MSKIIAQVVVGLPVEGPFDYSVHPSLQENITLGQRVLVSFNRKKRVAYVVALNATSEFKKLNPILEILENQPSIPLKALAFTKQFADYYGCSWGEAIETYLPKVLRSKRIIALEAPLQIKNAKREEPACCLLHSLSLDEQWKRITHDIQQTLSEGRGVIIATPDKASLERVRQRLVEDFSDQMAFVTEKMKVAQVATLFQDLYAAHKKLFVGTRSAIFAPVANIGLIIVTEEEHASYKQEQSPQYHTVELAQMRAKIEEARLLLTSTAPSTETWKKAQSVKWTKETILGEHKKNIQIVDMNNYNPQKTSIISFPLQNQIKKMVEQNKKVLLLLNRRGFNLMTQCNQCGHQVKCERCNVALTSMDSKKKLTCRQCHLSIDPLKFCPNCKGSYLRAMGSGIEKLESNLMRIYPHIFISTFDRDSPKLPARSSIVIATQAILSQRGNFKPDLVALLNVDSALHHFDYRSTHHVFALMMNFYEMAGEQLVIQTRYPDMTHIKAMQKQDFEMFYNEDLKQRKELSLPPYMHILAIGLRAKSEDLVVSSSSALAALLQERTDEHCEVLDPMPDAIPKLRDQYRYTIMIKSKSLVGLHQLAKAALKDFKKKSVIITFNVDP